MRTIGCMCLHSPPYPCTHTDLEQGSSPYSCAAKMNGLRSQEKGSAMSFKNLKSISQETSSLPHLKVSSCKNIHTFLGQWYLALCWHSDCEDSGLPLLGNLQYVLLESGAPTRVKPLPEPLSQMSEITWYY